MVTDIKPARIVLQSADHIATSVGHLRRIRSSIVSGRGCAERAIKMVKMLRSEVDEFGVPAAQLLEIRRQTGTLPID